MTTRVGLAALGVAALFFGTMGLGLIPTATAQFLGDDGYDLVGEDPAGDATWPVAAGTNEPSGQLGRGHLDIVAVFFANQEDRLQVRMNFVGAPLSGSGDRTHLVAFTVDGTNFLVCDRSIRAQSNGVLRYTDDSCVPPSSIWQGTRVGGNFLNSGTSAQTYARWEIPKSDLGLAGDAVGLEITNIVGWTLNLGVSSSGGTDRYAADRAPDADAWTHVLTDRYFQPEADGLAIHLSAETDTLVTVPGGSVQFALNVTLEGDDEAAVGFSVPGIPEAWHAQFSLDLVTMSPRFNQTTVNLTVQVPEGTAEGTYNLTAEAAADEDVGARLELVVVVSMTPPDGAATGSGGQGGSQDEGSSAANATDDEGADGGGTPGPGVLAALLALGVAFALGQRRRL